jgi:glycosyltransferase involved in cell wall biosynthesis
MKDTSAPNPRLSIGVPVYNGAKFLRATLDSLLSQTFADFELIITDNCSTDSTQQICLEYAARDPRVRYFRNDRNLGPAPNYNRCFELARGELFKWQAGDDLVAPDFLEKCIAELDRNPQAVAVYTATREIGPDGEPLFDHDTELDLSDPSISTRLARYSFVNHRRHHATELWAVIRADVMRRWQPTKGSFPSADRLVITRLILYGTMPRLNEYLFFNRSHGNRSQTYLDKMKVRPGSRLVKYIGCGPLPSYEWWDASKKGKIVFPEFRWVWEYFKAVHETPMPAGEKLKCYSVLCGLSIKFLPRFARDILIAGEQMLYRIIGRGPEGPAPAGTAPPKPAN